MAKITDNQRGLYTGELVAFCLKGLPCFKQLIEMGTIFSIENRNNFASGKLQCIIQRLWLCLGPASRHENQFEI